VATIDFTTNTDLNNRQEKISFSDSIFYAIVIGVGGIGSWVALDLALSGQVRNIVLIDPDNVEESNLNRTPFRISDIGLLKVEALRYIILERRCIDVFIYEQKSSKELADTIYNNILKVDPAFNNRSLMYERTVICDCRDNVYSDFYHLNSKYYKLGYDGMSITIDGNPKNTPVWGHQNGYNVIPSFVCPSQLVANLMVSDILIDQSKNVDDQNYNCDESGRLNDCFTIDTQHLVKELYMISKHRKDLVKSL